MTEARSALAPPPRLGAAGISLFADLDGTLALIEPTPDDVKPEPGRRRLLEALGLALDGRLAVISGRALGDLDRVLEGRVRAVGAVHGAVRRRADGRVIGGEPHRGIAETVDAFRAFAADRPGVIVEDKNAAATLHFRLAPEAREGCLDLAADMAGRFGLAIQPGDKVAEVRTPGPDKGAALAAFMAEPPFARSKPIFVGDDLTDEDGFAAAKSLGGFGVIVGSRRPTAAEYALADVPAAFDWLWSIAKERP